jgi:hypothetical protein
MAVGFSWAIGLRSLPPPLCGGGKRTRDLTIESQVLAMTFQAGFVLHLCFALSTPL